MDELIDFIEQEIIAPGGSDQYPDVINFQDEVPGVRNSSLPLELRFENQQDKSAGDLGVPDYLELSPSNLESFLRGSQSLHEDPPKFEAVSFSENCDEEEDLDAAAKELELLLEGGNESFEQLTESKEKPVALTGSLRQNSSSKKLLQRVDIQGSSSPSWALGVGTSQPEIKPRLVDGDPLPPSETTCHDYFHRPRVPSPRKQRKPSSPMPLQERDDSIGYNVRGTVFLENEKIDNFNERDNISDIKTVAATSFRAGQIQEPHNNGTVRVTASAVEEVPKTFYCRELGRELSMFNYHEFPEETQVMIMQQMRAGRQVIKLPGPSLREQASPYVARTTDTARHVPAVGGASLLHEAAMAAGLLDSESEGSLAEPSIRPTLLSPLRPDVQTIESGVNKREDRNMAGLNTDSGQISQVADVTYGHAQPPVSPFSKAQSPSEIHRIGFTNSPQLESPGSNKSEIGEQNSFDALSYLNDLMGNENHQRVDTVVANVSDQLEILAEMNQAPLEDNFASPEDKSLNQTQQGFLGSEVLPKEDLETCSKSVLRSVDKTATYHTDLFPYTGEEELDNERYLELISEPTAHIPGYESNVSSGEIDDFINEYFQESLPNTKTERSETIASGSAEIVTVALDDSPVKQGSSLKDGKVISPDELAVSDQSTTPFAVTDTINYDSVAFSPESEWKDLQSKGDINKIVSNGLEENTNFDLHEREVTPNHTPMQPANETVDAIDEINKYLLSLN